MIAIEENVLLVKIEGLENIRDLFSKFHDGWIVNCYLERDILYMDVEIQYLAERIDPSFHKFSIELIQVDNISFSTWPNNTQSQPEILTEISTIFTPDLEILQGKLRDDLIEVTCNQPSSDFGYCGGEIYFTALSAKVTDGAGKSYSLDELDGLCKGYWHDSRSS